jgi:hypothetical protein
MSFSLEVLEALRDKNCWGRGRGRGERGEGERVREREREKWTSGVSSLKP